MIGEVVLRPLSRMGSWDSWEAILILQGLRQLDPYGETATALGITVYRTRQKWTYARAWLRDALDH
jgi:hypothetical protein